MMHMKRPLSRGLLAALMLAGLAMAACSSVVADPTPVSTFKITPAPANYTPPPAAGATVAPTEPLPTAAGDTGTSSPGTTPATATSLSLSAENVEFDTSELQASAGVITIEFHNDDSGVPHNLHVLEGVSSEGATALASGPVEQTLKLELKPGTYVFQCDAHPTSMKGTITVS